MLEIKPGIGLGSLNFGNTPEDAERIMGQSQRTLSHNHTKEQIFSNGIKLSFRNDKLYQIAASRRSNGILFEGKDIFNSNPLDILRLFEIKSNGAFECYGFILFLSLGVSLTGFHDDDIDDKSVTVSVLEEWDSLSAELIPISFLS